MEIEVKFYLSDLPALQRRLETLGARLLQARTHELNLRFDTPDGRLERNQQVLRLRQDRQAVMTYKGPGEDRQGVRHREEIECTVSDFQTACSLLEALGYQVSWVYEKYRTVYALGEVELMLDELPFGDFVEIEGPDVAALQQAAARMHLNWTSFYSKSYQALFAELVRRLNLEFRDLTFENFAPLTVSPDLLGVQSGDQAQGDG